MDNPRRLVALRRATTGTPSPAVEEARRVLFQQATTLEELAARVDERFAHAVELMLATPGRVVVMGVGKSGQIGQKIASSLASTGTPAMFINANEAYHGDLGMITAQDTVVLISHSGETVEVVGLIPHLRALGLPLIAMVGQQESSLARQVDVVLDVSVDREACPNNLAPTSSSLATLALGDALVVALMKARAFTPRDFARNHPGGSLGRQLHTRVRDVMRANRLPIVAPGDSVGDSLITMTEGRLGLVLVMTGERLVGLVTDGDLRRAMQRDPAVLATKVSEIMTNNPVTIGADTPLADAHARMQAMKLKALVVLDEDGKLAGVVEVFDHEGEPRGG